MHPEAIGGETQPPVYRQIADDLRRRISRGELAAGAELPTQEALMRRYGVSRATIRRAQDLLREDGLLDESVQGRSPHVRGLSTLHPQVDDCLMRAFAEEEVTLDVVSVTMQSLVEMLQSPVKAVKEGRLSPVSISVRALLPARSSFQDLPQLIDHPADRRPGDRLQNLSRTFANALWADLSPVEERGLATVSVQIRTLRQLPGHKFYILNDAEVLFGSYTVRVNQVWFDAPGSEERYSIYDVHGVDVSMLHFHRPELGGSARDADFVDQQRTWFDSRWDTVAVPWNEWT